MLYSFKDAVLKDNAMLYTAITGVRGVGTSRSLNACAALGLQKNLRVSSLNTYQFFVFSVIINESYGNDVYLLRLRDNRIRLLLTTRSYKSLKYSYGLPIRGQKTRANGKTAKRRVRPDLAKRRLSVKKRRK